jgi:hypothetical protein
LKIQKDGPGGGKTNKMTGTVVKHTPERVREERRNKIIKYKQIFAALKM